MSIRFTGLFTTESLNDLHEHSIRELNMQLNGRNCKLISLTPEPNDIK